MDTFTDYYRELSPDEKKELANNSGISLAYLSQIATGYRSAGWKTITRLIKADQTITHEMFEPGPQSAA